MCRKEVGLRDSQVFLGLGRTEKNSPARCLAKKEGQLAASQLL